VRWVCACSSHAYLQQMVGRSAEKLSVTKFTALSTLFRELTMKSADLDRPWSDDFMAHIAGRASQGVPSLGSIAIMRLMVVEF
jgi:hypothetical protein